MSQNTPTSNDLIDEMLKKFFAVGPVAFAELARGDEQTEMRRGPGMPATSDPLDGADVFVRRMIAACVAMREHPGPVALVTETQAQAAGWPSARIANAMILLAWGLHIGTQVSAALPVLYAAAHDATEPVSGFVRADDRLPAFDELVDMLYRDRSIATARHRLSARLSQSVPAPEGRRIAPLYDLVEEWLGVDAHAVPLPSDRWGPKMTSSGARAAGVLAWVATEALDVGWILHEERGPAVRVKTVDDAGLAGQPGAAAANLAMLLGAAVNHGLGYTVNVLPPREQYAEALAEAGRSIAHHNAGASDAPGSEVVDVLELQDLAARGFLHVGRRAARRVAQRLYDDVVKGGAHDVPSTADASR